MKKIFNLRNFFIIIVLSISAVILSYSMGAYYNYIYPMSFSDQIKKTGEKYNVDPAIIASVANVESGFNEQAVSNKGAVGLMQLMPSTARWLASKIHVEYDENKLKNAEYNLDLGSFYISFLIEHFQDEKVGICAYNAGQDKKHPGYYPSFIFMRSQKGDSRKHSVDRAQGSEDQKV